MMLYKFLKKEKYLIIICAVLLTGAILLPDGSDIPAAKEVPAIEIDCTEIDSLHLN